VAGSAGCGRNKGFGNRQMKEKKTLGAGGKFLMLFYPIPKGGSITAAGKKSRARKFRQGIRLREKGTCFFLEEKQRMDGSQAQRDGFRGFWGGNKQGGKKTVVDHYLTVGGDGGGGDRHGPHPPGVHQIRGVDILCTETQKGPWYGRTAGYGKRRTKKGRERKTKGREAI